MARFKQISNDKDDRKNLIDEETGELFNSDQAFTAILIKRKNNGFDKGTFLTMSQSEQLRIAKDTTLNLTDYRVLMYVGATLDYQNFILIDQSSAANEIQMAQAQFSRSLKRLQEKGFLIKGPKVNKNVTFRLSPELGWKGDGRTHQKALQEHRKTLEDRKKAANITHVIHSKTEAELLEEQGQDRLF